jgi:peptide/nickel transport system substrate-binding protein
MLAGMAGIGLAACGGPSVPAVPSSASAKPTAAPSGAGAPAGPTTAPAAKPAVAAAPTTSAPAPAAGTPKRGGIYRTTFDTGLTTLNPILSTTSGLFYNLLYDPLIRYRLIDVATCKYEALPALATEWTWGNENKEITFKLRPGVKFHDGSDWNADVAKWNFDLMMTHPKSFAKPYVEGITQVDVVDPMQIKLSLKAPLAPLLSNLSDTTGIVAFISKAQYEKLGEDAFGQNPSGTGAMKFDSWVKENKVSISRFDGYWGKGADGQPLPYIDAAEYRLIPEPATAMAELKTGNLDWLVIDAKDIAEVKANSDLVYSAAPGSGSFYITIGLNQRDGVFGQNLKLRQAALYAFNRDAAVKTFAFGQAAISTQPFWVEGMIGYDPTLPSYGYDPAKAKALMSEAGFANGLDIGLSVIQRPLEQQVAQFIKQMWDSVGIRTRLEVLERTAWINRMKEGTAFDAAFWRPPASTDPDEVGRQLLTGAGGNWGGYSNPDVDRLMAEGRSTFDQAKRQEIYRQVQMKVYDDACIGSGYYLPETVAYRKTLMNVSYDAKQARFHEAWIDK